MGYDRADAVPGGTNEWRKMRWARATCPCFCSRKNSTTFCRSLFGLSPISAFISLYLYLVGKRAREFEFHAKSHDHLTSDDGGPAYLFFKWR